MSGIKFECALCGQRIEVAPDMSGMTINCPMCSGNVTVPGARLAIPMAAIVKDTAREASAPAAPPHESPQAPRPLAAPAVQPASPPAVVPVQKETRPRPAAAAKPGTKPSLASDWNTQGLALGGFVLLIIGALAFGRHASPFAYRLFYLFASVVGLLALARRQLLGATTLLLCAMAAFIFSKPERMAPLPPPPANWVETVHPSQPAVKPVQPAQRPPTVTRTPTPATVRSPGLPPATATKQREPSDDPFRDTLGPDTPAEAAPTPGPGTTEPPTPAIAKPSPTENEIVLETDRLCSALIEKPEDVESLEKLRKEIKVVLDVDKRVRLMTAYALGCMHVGKPRDAAVAQAYLQKQYADHPTVKFLSPAAISDGCQRCSGKGATEIPCPECKGQSKCPTCDGAGTTSLRGMDGKSMTAKCPSCGGSGKCRRCRGAGKIVSTCPDCNGARGRLSPARIKHNYLALLKGNTNLIEVAASAPAPAPAPEPAPQPVETPKAPTEGEPADGPPEF